MKKVTSDKILLDVGIQNPADVTQAFELLILLGLKMLGADEGSLLVYRKEQKDLQFVCTFGGDTPKNLTGETVPIGKGITGMAAMLKEIQTSTRTAGNQFFNVPDDGSPNSVIAAPILLDDELLGVVTAVSFDLSKSFSSDDCQKFAIVAELGAIILKWSQQIEAFHSNVKASLTKQEAMEKMALEQTIKWLRNHPDKSGKIVQILTMLGEL
ncbi:MAG: GAF domain-containing protein [Victivallales bacterium]|nr:GAF domain-containing protein [Victivallales bacterium]MBR6058711.1 GAF domain-containing protein [Victivallales bacterium]